MKLITNKILNLKGKLVAVTLVSVANLSATVIKADGAVTTCRGTQYGVTCIPEKTALSQSEMLLLAVLVFTLAVVILSVYKYFKANIEL